MSAVDALALYEAFEAAGAPIWIDGGWSVDANLRQQTREHADLDIVIEARHVPAALRMLDERGYRPLERADSRPWNFVYGDDHGHEVDFHVIELDQAGNGIYGPPENDDWWPEEALVHRGTLLGRTVRATSPTWLVASHTGYALKPKDRHDVLLLCERFGLPVPAEYEAFGSGD